MHYYRPESVYSMDRTAVAQDCLTEIELMQRAGACVWRYISKRWPGISVISIFAGAGNNGGDAFVVALLAAQAGLRVQLISKGDLTRQSKTSTHYSKLWQQLGGAVEDWQGQKIEGQCIVDGLLGIGLNKTLNNDWQALIKQINECAVPKIAIDIPSGLNATTGVPQTCAIEAQATITFIGRKIGHCLADGPDYCGELIFDDLGISSATALSQTAALTMIDKNNAIFPDSRKLNSHKNSYGHILIIGGDKGMSGAVALAAKAALRTGAGMVSALVHPDCVNNLSAIPEVMTQSWFDIQAKLDIASVVVIGPGLGESQAAQDCLKCVSTIDKPLVVDASALTQEFLSSLSTRQVVITPHPGEAARLLNDKPSAIQMDRFLAAEQLCNRFGFVAVLKGSGTIICDSNHAPAVNLRGNPGMATAGMGDVLTGMIGALIGQRLAIFEAARTGVYLHALCAEAFTESADQSGLIASDIIDRIPEIMLPLRHA